MAAVHPHSPITSTDRLGLTLFFAIVIHALIILGISFSQEMAKNKPENTPTLEIILAHTPTKAKVENPDFLAQAHQEGGGTSEAKHRPTAPPPSLLPAPVTGNAPVNQAPAAFQATVAPQAPQITTLRNPAQQAVSADEPSPAPHVTSSAAELVMRSREIARLEAELSESVQAYARRPKHRFISAKTAQYRDAAYLAAWQAKIESIGTLNYPEEARRRNISGELLLDVALNPDGTLNAISLRRSSGYQALDDAAKRIVQLAAPFSPFPDGMRKDTDVLHITRTWQFLGNRLETGQ
ncbi:MAG: energy transducer TonB [Gammaproteobacteria bacterium]|jgi:protein TonB|nr:energy transducer TonB [Gammaproteobacteria bacterium]